MRKGPCASLHAAIGAPGRGRPWAGGPGRPRPPCWGPPSRRAPAGGRGARRPCARVHGRLQRPERAESAAIAGAGELHRVRVAEQMRAPTPARREARRCPAPCAPAASCSSPESPRFNGIRISTGTSPDRPNGSTSGWRRLRPPAFPQRRHLWRRRCLAAPAGGGRCNPHPRAHCLYRTIGFTPDSPIGAGRRTSIESIALPSAVVTPPMASDDVAPVTSSRGFRGR